MFHAAAKPAKPPAKLRPAAKTSIAGILREMGNPPRTLNRPVKGENRPSTAFNACRSLKSFGEKSGPASPAESPLRQICATPSTSSPLRMGMLMIFWMASLVRRPWGTPSKTVACRETRIIDDVRPPLARRARRQRRRAREGNRSHGLQLFRKHEFQHFAARRKLQHSNLVRLHPEQLADLQRHLARPPASVGICRFSTRSSKRSSSVAARVAIERIPRTRPIEL